MGNFNRHNDNRGGRSFDRRPAQMFPATCSNCGNSCEVPFKPTGSKPVLCNNCFRAQGGPDHRSDNRRSFDKPRFDERRSTPPPSYQPQFKEQFESLNYKLDKILKILQAATAAETPVQTSEISIPHTEVVETPAPEKKKRTPKKASEAIPTE